MVSECGNGEESIDLEAIDALGCQLVELLEDAGLLKDKVVRGVDSPQSGSSIPALSYHMSPSLPMSHQIVTSTDGREMSS